MEDGRISFLSRKALRRVHGSSARVEVARGPVTVKQRKLVLFHFCFRMNSVEFWVVPAVAAHDSTVTFRMEAERVKILLSTERNRSFPFRHRCGRFQAVVSRLQACLDAAMRPPLLLSSNSQKAKPAEKKID